MMKKINKIKMRITDSALKAKEKARKVKEEYLDRALLDSSKQKLDDIKKRLSKFKDVRDGESELMQKLGERILIKAHQIRKGLSGAGHKETLGSTIKNSVQKKKNKNNLKKKKDLISSKKKRAASLSPSTRKKKSHNLLAKKSRTNKTEKK